MNLQLPILSLGQQVVAYGVCVIICLFASIVNVAAQRTIPAVTMGWMAIGQGVFFIFSFKKWIETTVKQKVKDEFTAQNE